MKSRAAESDRTETPDDHEVLHPDALRRVELALEELRAGRMVILVDDEDRENEGDLVVAAEKITPEAINFMAVHARGLICLALTPEQVDRLGLTMMATHNQSPFNTAFTVSIEAREGVTTGISAADRARTVQVAIDHASNRRHLVTPGHMFPLRARPGGVLERVGQTEGSVDLARLAGLDPSAVICEVMKDDGTMARLPDLLEFGHTHGVRIVAVADLIKYRMRTERIVAQISEGDLDLGHLGLGTWRTRLYRGRVHDELHMALWPGRLEGSPTLVRVQAAPPAWAFLDEQNKLSRQALAAARAIREEGSGCLVLMHLGGGTVEQLQRAFTMDFEGEREPAPQARAAALRDLGTGCQILVDLGVEDLRLMTRSSRPIVGVEAYGLNIVEKVSLPDTVG